MMTILAASQLPSQLQRLDYTPPSRALPQATHRQRSRISRLMGAFRAWSDRLHDRDMLLRLDDRLLADIGFTRHEIEVLARRPLRQD